MIHVIIPSYNMPVEIARAIDSVHTQEFQNFHIVVIDDASPDSAHTKAAKLRCQYNGWTFIRNEENLKAPYTLKQGIQMSGAAPDDIIFLLDGDDHLPPWALGYINDVYERYPQFWMTYGNYQPHPYGWLSDSADTPASEYPTLVRLERTFRQHNLIRFNHPLTFKRFLWDQLSDDDLKSDEGEWFRYGYDEAIVLPMLEMAAPDHYACLDKMLYYYNTENPISDSKMKAQGLLESKAWQIWERPQKPQLIR